MKRIAKTILPLLLLAVAVVVGQAVMDSSEEPVQAPVGSLAPVVRSVVAERSAVALEVVSHGTVMPRTESRLVPRVAGRVVWISPSFVAGGFFEEGEALVRLDTRDRELASISAAAEVARAELLVALEESEAQVALAEWTEREEGPADALVLRAPQLAEARALLAAARARLEQSELDLARTEIVAPYAGRVRKRVVDIGRYVQPGTELAVLYSVDRAEIRLPVPDADLAFLDVPLAYRGMAPEEGHLAVTVEAEFAGRRWTWPGRIVRTEGEIDPRNRMLHLVAVVEDPYGQGGEKGRPPLAVGLFVKATLHGSQLEDVVVLPRESLRGIDSVYVIDEEQHLRFTPVVPLRVERDRVILASGVVPGERVCTSILETAVDGMPVRLATGDDAP